MIQRVFSVKVPEIHMKKMPKGYKKIKERMVNN
jgi:hypothetical protein